MSGGGGGSTQIKDSESTKKLANIAARRFNLYQQYYVPLENQFIGEVLNLTSVGKFADVAGVVSASLNPEFQNARNMVINRMTSSGVDPSSGKFRANLSNITNVQGSSIGRGSAAGQSAQLDRYYQGLENIVAIGQGQAGTAMSGLGDVATLAGNVARGEARAGLTDYMARQEAVGTAVGSGIGFGVGLGVFT